MGPQVPMQHFNLLWPRTASAPRGIRLSHPHARRQRYKSQAARTSRPHTHPHRPLPRGPSTTRGYQPLSPHPSPAALQREAGPSETHSWNQLQTLSNTASSSKSSDDGRRRRMQLRAQGSPVTRRDPPRLPTSKFRRRRRSSTGRLAIRRWESHPQQGSHRRHPPTTFAKSGRRTPSFRDSHSPGPVPHRTRSRRHRDTSSLLQASNTQFISS